MTKDENLMYNDECERIDEHTGHRLNEIAQMNPPEEELGDIGILVYVESEDYSMKEPHFHFCKDKVGNGYKYAVDIEVKIGDIDEMTILCSETGYMTWRGVEESRQIVTEWLNRKAYDAEMLNKEAVRQTWNSCNISNRGKKEEL